VPSPRRVFVAPRPLVFTFDTILRRPMVDYNPAGPDAVIGSDFCRRSTDCAVVASGPVGAGEAITDSASGRDMAARIIGSPMRPRYPEGLRTAGLAGRVVVQFIIDSTGRVEVASIRVLESTHALFAAAVLEVLPRYRFVAAEANGRQTRMTVQMPFEFTLDRR
jgi:TonB family protein